MKRLIIIILSLLSSPIAAQNDPAVLNKKAVDQGNKGQFIDAQNNFNKAIDSFDKETAKTIHNIGWLYEIKGESQNALVFYEEALKRNGDQIHTLERAGHIHYTTGNFDKAIVYGEKAMKLDPMNKEVITWLPDAYAQMFKSKQQNISKTDADHQQKKIDDQVKEKKAEEKKFRRYITATYEMTVRSSYLRAGGNGFHYTSTDAYGYNFPHMFTVDLSPFDSWQAKLNTGVPYYGALSPDLIWWTEKAEGYFYKNTYFLGIGFMGNHYGGYNTIGTSQKMSDYKLGIVFGKYEDRSRLEVAFYPRMFPSDTGTVKKDTLDVDSMDISYWYIPQDDMKLYFSFSMNDFYLFDNVTPVSYYFGVYSLSAGIGFYDKVSSPYVIRLSIIERMYLENLANERPYSFMNGQGTFGLDAYNWFKGKPMSGIKTFSTAFSLYAEERIIPRFFLFQKISAEIVGKKQYGNDFCLTIGVGGYY